ncbi:MAG TPA: aquaporin [Candidatus Binatia bacterium]|nr:aquaporin [Candidatus Binatia bacterium]
MAHTIPAPCAAQPQAGDLGPRTPTAGPSPSQAHAISRAARLCGSPLLAALRRHWPEYVMEGAELGLFMISACAFVVLLEHPTSSVHQSIPDPVLRRTLMGMAMGLTAMGIIYSPLGQRSGAHFNPAVTLTFFRLGKVELWDAAFYSAAQFVGGLTGVVLSAAVLGDLIAHPSVRYAATVPGMSGVRGAFLAEVVISFMQMSLVLRATNTPGLARFTGLFAGAMVAAYISLEAPYSGMSMNPARTFSSALPARLWTGLWIYFTAPPLGMLLAAELYVRRWGVRQVFCAKLHHHNNKRCIFRCGYKMGTGC